MINKDIPTEYFTGLNKKLARLNSHIEDIKIADALLKKEKHTHNDLTESCYYRLLIPQLLPQLDQVLYLDSDVIVDGNLDKLFALNIDDYLLAAGKDVAFLEIAFGFIMIWIGWK